MPGFETCLLMTDMAWISFSEMEVSESTLHQVRQCQRGCKAEKIINSFYKSHYSESSKVSGIFTLKRNITAA